MSYQPLFEKLWQNYTERNPHALKIHALFTQQGETLINDHIAFRTFNDPRININQLAKIFTALGYHEAGEYHFPIKKLYAKHYEHTDPDAPKIFISELLLEKMSPTLQRIVNESLNSLNIPKILPEEFLWSGAPWLPLCYETYSTLLKESEYAAWMYAFGFCPNHFTVNVNALNHFKDIQSVNDFLLHHGFCLNASGGLIKGTPADYLEQSSTLAEEIEVSFNQQNYKIPSCYYEFAKRYPLPNGKLYSGFVAASADKIFESTDVGKRS